MTCKDCIHYKMCYFRLTEKIGSCEYEPFWHTGEPTDEGWYLCTIKHNDKLSYEATYFKDKFLWIDVSADMSEFVSAWHKIPQF